MRKTKHCRIRWSPRTLHGEGMTQSSSANFRTDPHPAALQTQNRLAIFAARNPNRHPALKKSRSGRHLSQEIYSDAQRQHLKMAPARTVVTVKIYYRQKPSNIAYPSAVASTPRFILSLALLQRSQQKKQTLRICSPPPTTPDSLTRLNSNTPHELGIANLFHISTLSRTLDPQAPGAAEQ